MLILLEYHHKIYTKKWIWVPI